ncbi:carboxylesterase family protein [Microbacterium testaceum]|uniref:carboxylesterase family protein n=1 Tax=Microbacterium testaceum TaxID=2033 RepID=UPI000734E3F8|nr:carboxylesterase family protein [Microbacterium testaceum]
MSAAIDSWRGVRFATLVHPFAAPVLTDPVAPARPGGHFGPAPIQAPVAGFDLPAGQSATDCLTLNVWAPRGVESAPVAVWLFGGGFEMGTASTPVFDGASLAAAAQSVVVTLNYRVGAFGFGAFAQRGGELSAAHDLGVQDVCAALRWIAAAVPSFGGDASRLTLVGQSAGAFLAAAAAVAPGVPRPRALACFSGGASRVIAADDATRFGEAILDQLDTPHLIDLDPETVLAAQAAVAPRDLGVRNGVRPVGFGVAIDGGSPDAVVPRHPLDAVRDGLLRDTFVLAAAGTDEMEGFGPGAVPDLEGPLAEAVHTLTGAAPEGVVDAYGREDPTAAWRHLLGDYIYRLPAARLVAAQRATGGGAAYLEVGREGDEPGGHGAELAGIFARGDDARSRAIQEILVTLIRDGRVDGGALDAALVAGVVPAASIAPDDLVSIWQGVARP